MPNSFRSFITKPPSTARDGVNLCLYRLLPLPHLSSNHSKFLFGEAAAIIVVDTILRLLHLACVQCNSIFLLVSNSINTSVHLSINYFQLQDSVFDVLLKIYSVFLLGPFWGHQIMGTWLLFKHTSYCFSCKYWTFDVSLNFLNIHCLLNKNQPGKNVFIFLGDLDPSCLRCSWNHWSLQLEGLTKNLATRVQPKSQAMLKILYIWRSQNL